jgi:hypothetical protein
MSLSTLNALQKENQYHQNPKMPKRKKEKKEETLLIFYASFP